MFLTELTELPPDQPDVAIKGLTADSREVKPGWLFAALPGTEVNGADFIPQALEKGASALVIEPGVNIIASKGPVAVIADENPRRRLARIAGKFYQPQPGHIVAVTGTNGKSSVVDFCRQIWTALGYDAASMGTLGVRSKAFTEDGSHTTPDPVTLHQTLLRLAKKKIDYVALEASSHGLHQSRLDGLDVKVAGFTSFSHDHLDYHGTAEDYLIAKAHLFTDILSPDGVAVLNADISEYDDLTRRLKAPGVRILSYGKKGADIKLLEVTPHSAGQEMSFEIAGQSYQVTIPLPGRFQVMNILCAVGMVMAALPQDKALVEKIVKALPAIEPVPGRLERVVSEAAIYIDYAHTPDALEAVLQTLSRHCQGRLICVFGCGGDRDKTKRPVMGAIAEKQADLVIITDDNSRFEDPAKIRAAIKAGAPSAIEIADRAEAIAYAVKEMQAGDIVVIAGKGHETGQAIKGEIRPFSDREAARAAWDKRAEEKPHRVKSKTGEGV